MQVSVTAKGKPLTAKVRLTPERSRTAWTASLAATEVASKSGAPCGRCKRAVVFRRPGRVQSAARANAHKKAASISGIKSAIITLYLL
ncbi:Uncharacterized protein YR821_p20008 (plasmid) [Yersinia ruckeri]|nr:Uncharacterized protein YR821_p20008 [Yersinia ruckeri]